MAKGDPRTGGGSGYFPAIYQSAISQSGSDYDSIMDQYKNLGQNVSGQSSGGNYNFSPLNPTFTQYEPSADYSRLKSIADTGGFSEGDISNIRERSISPIRSIYDSANRNLLRQKNLQGGYAPNMGAAQAKMARESSNIIGAKTTEANANIAEMVQRGKLAGATALAPLEAAEARRRQAVMDMNTNIANQIAMYNSQGARSEAEINRSSSDNDFNKILETIRGQQSIYGTTPALASTFGNQVLSAANTVNNFPPIQQGSMGRPRPFGTMGSSNSPFLGSMGARY